MTTSSVLSVNIGKAVAAAYASSKDGRTAIDKRPAPGRVRATRLGLAGDEQADRKHHGGVDQAVYAYAREDLDHWQAELGRPLHAGQFGENLTTVGLDLAGAVIGERWRIGTVLLEVSAPRIPCSVFQAWLGEARWVKRFTVFGHTGAYLRVLTEGELAAGDAIEVEHRPAHGVTVLDAFRVLGAGDRELAPRLLEAPELAAKGHAHVRRLVSLADRSG
jgi:MOSC domain-containing protein YiiM